MVEEKESGSKRDVSDEWIRNNVYEALETIEMAERRIYNGCVDLIEYIQELRFGIQRIPEIQLKAMEMMIVEFNILLENTHEIVTKDQYDEARKKLDLLSLVYDSGKAYKIISNREGKIKRMVVLNPLFWKLAKSLSKLRSKMVKNLKHILFLKNMGKDKEEKGED